MSKIVEIEDGKAPGGSDETELSATDAVDKEFANLLEFADLVEEAATEFVRGGVSADEDLDNATKSDLQRNYAELSNYSNHRSSVDPAYSAATQEADAAPFFHGTLPQAPNPVVDDKSTTKNHEKQGAELQHQTLNKLEAMVTSQNKKVSITERKVDTGQLPRGNASVEVGSMPHPLVPIVRTLETQIIHTQPEEDEGEDSTRYVEQTLAIDDFGRNDDDGDDDDNDDENCVGENQAKQDNTGLEDHQGDVLRSSYDLDRQSSSVNHTNPNNRDFLQRISIPHGKIEDVDLRNGSCKQTNSINQDSTASHIASEQTVYPNPGQNSKKENKEKGIQVESKLEIKKGKAQNTAGYLAKSASQQTRTILGQIVDYFPGSIPSTFDEEAEEEEEEDEDEMSDLVEVDNDLILPEQLNKTNISTVHSAAARASAREETNYHARGTRPPGGGRAGGSESVAIGQPQVSSDGHQSLNVNTPLVHSHLLTDIIPRPEYGNNSKGYEGLKRKAFPYDEEGEHAFPPPPKSTSTQQSLRSFSSSGSQDSAFKNAMKKAGENSQGSSQSNLFARTPPGSQQQGEPGGNLVSVTCSSLSTPKHQNPAESILSSEEEGVSFASPSSTKGGSSNGRTAVSPYVAMSQRTYRSAGENLWDDVPMFSEHCSADEVLSQLIISRKTRRSLTPPANRLQSEWLKTIWVLGFQLPCSGPMLQYALGLAAVTYANCTGTHEFQMIPSNVPEGIMPAVHRDLCRFFSVFSFEERRRIRRLLCIPGMTFQDAQFLVRLYGPDVMGSQESMNSVKAMHGLTALEKISMLAAIQDKSFHDLSLDVPDKLVSQTSNAQEEQEKMDFLNVHDFLSRVNFAEESFEVNFVQVPEIWQSVHQQVLICLHGNATFDDVLEELVLRWDLISAGPLGIQRNVGYMEEVNNAGQCVTLWRALGVHRSSQSDHHHIVVDMIFVRESWKMNESYQSKAGSASESSLLLKPVKAISIAELLKLYYRSRSSRISLVERKASAQAISTLQQQLQLRFPDVISTLRQFLALVPNSSKQKTKTEEAPKSSFSSLDA